MKALEQTLFVRTPVVLGLALVVGAALLAGCTVTQPNSPTATSSQATDASARIDADVDATLDRLYQVVAGSREMVQQAAGVLVFPKVRGGALIIGGEYGQGALRIHDRTVGYYSTTGASIGWQAGASSKAVIFVFNSGSALDAFRASDGWQVGADASVAIGHIGATGSLDSTTAGQPVVGFVMNNAGVEGGVSLDGAKITPIQPS